MMAVTNSVVAPALSVENLSVTFQTRKGPVTAVNDVSFHVNPGEVLGVVGESGSGKSVTGLATMGLIDAPGRVSAGRVVLEGRNIAGVSDRDMRGLRGNRIAMIFQDPISTLNPVLRIDTQIMEAITAHERISASAARARAIDALRAVGIPSPESRLEAYPHQFSGGMRQRVAIAIALLHRPAVLIADEPTTALDVTIQVQILGEVQKLAAESGTALVWITHDLSVVAGLADRIAVMYAGRIVESGTVAEVLTAPRHHYTAGLIASVPSRNRRGQPLAQIPGSTPNLANMPSGCAFHPRCSVSSEICSTTLPPLLHDPSGRFMRCHHPRQGA
ncbi:ABC transporter ATP-binding protein [Rhizobium sp. SL86]|uniref:ABC transporter ATP-binding protein n=1 Tax=Rhizobium sp. SL86 TaxID=2995148 RepID=UPI0022758852|nr:ABC transporter ATP-binding protein [Rhizobium sp. SL86]MCY1667409.1 ABC transporter ATP-binding protein [Rhizobium sp. SL86]